MNQTLELEQRSGYYGWKWKIQSKNQKNNSRYDACLVKQELHICGIFYNNEKEIGFYSSDRIPNDAEEYDSLRNVCFGSVFRPQTNKYNYYNIKISISTTICTRKIVNNIYFEVVALHHCHWNLTNRSSNG